MQPSILATYIIFLLYSLVTCEGLFSRFIIVSRILVLLPLFMLKNKWRKVIIYLMCFVFLKADSLGLYIIYIYIYIYGYLTPLFNPM